MSFGTVSSSGDPLMRDLAGWYRYVTTDTGSDPYFDNVVLLINADEVIGDASKYANYLTTSTGLTRTTSISKHGSGSMYFRGETTSDFVRVSAGDTNFIFGTGDLTVEMWVYCLAYNTQSAVTPIYDGRTTTGGVTTQVDLRLTSGKLNYMNGGFSRIADPNNFPLNQWVHVALSRVSGSSRLFVNGTQVGSTYADTNSFNSTTVAPWIGKLSDNNPTWNGYMDSVRVTKGVGRYTSSFTPPGQFGGGRRLADSSGKGNHGLMVSPTQAAGTDKFGNSNSAIVLDGATSNRVVPLGLSTLPLYQDGGSHSIAMWVNGASQTNLAMFAEGSTAGNNPLHYLYASTTKVTYGIRDNTATFKVGTLSSNAVVFDSTWHHIAATYNGSTGKLTLYVDGAQDNTATYATGWTMGATFNRSTLGGIARASIGNVFAGSMADIRLYRRAITASEVYSLYAATQRI